MASLHPETLIEDRPVRFGAYAPENFDLTFQGTVTVRRALQLSLNVPAVALLDAVGTEPAERAHPPGRRHTGAAEGEAPGLAIGLGGLGIKLADLTMLYTGLARGGDAVLTLTERIGVERPQRRAGCSIRSRPGHRRHPVGTPPPENAAGGRIAYKTGTSYGYRDAWSVGFDGARPSASGSAGRTARRSRACRTHRGGADPVRRLRAHR